MGGWGGGTMNDGFGPPHRFAKSYRLASNPIIVSFSLALPWLSSGFLGIWLGALGVQPPRHCDLIHPANSFERRSGRLAARPAIHRRKGKREKKKKKKFAPYPIIIWAQISEPFRAVNCIGLT